MTHAELYALDPRELLALAEAMPSHELKLFFTETGHTLRRYIELARELDQLGAAANRELSSGGAPQRFVELRLELGKKLAEVRQLEQRLPELLRRLAEHTRADETKRKLERATEGVLEVVPVLVDGDGGGTSDDDGGLWRD